MKKLSSIGIKNGIVVCLMGAITACKSNKTINLLGGFLDWQAKGKAVEK